MVLIEGSGEVQSASPLFESENTSSICEAMHKETLVVHGGAPFDSKTGAVSVPIYQSSTFRHPGLYQTTGYDYSRLQNPTREAAEHLVARLEGGSHGFAFPSGMAATACVTRLFGPGNHIIVSDDLYGGTYRLFEEILRGYGFDFSYVDTGDAALLTQAVKPNTVAFFVETPSNPMMQITDISFVAELAHKINALLIVDNTFLTPIFQKPLELGADIIIHSGTKYLAGHNDTLAGFAVTNSDSLAEKLKLIHKSEGAVLSPFDSWLVIRGIKTLALRMKKHDENAHIIAEWLTWHPAVDAVYYAGLKSHPRFETNRLQASGSGGMISFSVRDARLVEQILGKVKLILFAESLGGVETLITYPMVQTHASIPPELRERIGVNERLLRLSVGIEHVQDLLADLEQAML